MIFALIHIKWFLYFEVLVYRHMTVSCFLYRRGLGLQLIASPDFSKATGADSISARILKGTCTSCITPSLTKIICPSELVHLPKVGNVQKCIVPIPKGGYLSSPTNYRPISILPILSKVLEKHVHSIISDHLLLHSPISDQQCMKLYWMEIYNCCHTVHGLMTVPRLLTEARKFLQFL